MFSQTTEYALRAMACLALAPEELMPTSTVAERTKVPANYLAKVLQQLAGGGLIKGRRGVGGGYMLARRAEDISLLEIINTVGDLHRIDSCPSGLPGHGNCLCPLHRAMDQAAEMIMNLFGSVSLKNLVNDPAVANRPLCVSVAAIAAITQ